MSFYSRENPLLERKRVPCELLLSEKSSPNDFRKQKGLFTLRVLQGHRSTPQNDGGTERSIRLELSDEYNHAESMTTQMQKTKLDSSLQSSMATNTHLGQTRHGPIHFPALRQTNFISTSIEFPNVKTTHPSSDEIDLRNCDAAFNVKRSIHLYELEVGESDFAQLRKDQALLVEFSDFSTSLIELLMQCDLGEQSDDHEVPDEDNVKSICGHNSAGKKFSCRIEDFSKQSKGNWNGNKRESLAKFSIVESNQFRELVHLSLDIEKCTDSTIRSYLSARLSAIIGENAMLKFQLKNEKERASLGEKACNDVSQKYNELMSISEKERNALAQEAGESIQKENTKRYRELQAIKRASDEQIEKLKEEMEGQRAFLQSKIDEIETENVRLADINGQKDAALSSLERRYKSNEMNNELSKTGMKGLQEKLNIVECERDEFQKSLKQCESFSEKLEISNEQYESRLVSSQKELASSTEIIHKLRLERESCSAKLNSLQIQLSNYKEEEGKARGLLCRYQQDRQEMKRRMKSKVELIQKQEEILASMEINSTDTQERLVESNNKCECLQEELVQVKTLLVRAERELNDNKKALNENKQVRKL